MHLRFIIFVDHGIFRFKWRSLYQISKNVYRCNQPFPWQIIADQKKRGIKTVINLRGIRHCSSYYLEKETCENNNIKLINFPVTSRDTPKTFGGKLNFKIELLSYDLDTSYIEESFVWIF